MVAPLLPAIPRTSAAATAMPTAEEKKWCMTQRHHLREVAHRGFAGIALPVGVGEEAGGGVEREMVRHGRQALRIQRQNPCRRSRP